MITPLITLIGEENPTHINGLVVSGNRGAQLNTYWLYKVRYAGSVEIFPLYGFGLCRLAPFRVL